MAAVEILVKARSKHDRIWLTDSGGLVVAVMAPPVEGRANAAVTRMLARALGVPQSAVRIVRGAGSKRKAIVVDGLGDADILRRVGESESTTRG